MKYVAGQPVELTLTSSWDGSTRPINKVFDPKSNPDFYEMRFLSREGNEYIATWKDYFYWLKNYWYFNKQTIIEDLQDNQGWVNIEAFLEGVPAEDQYFILLCNHEHGVSRPRDMKFDLGPHRSFRMMARGNDYETWNIAVNYFKSVYVQNIGNVARFSLSSNVTIKSIALAYARYMAASYALNANQTIYNYKPCLSYHLAPYVPENSYSYPQFLRIQEVFDPSDRSRHHQIYNYSKNILEFFPEPWGDKTCNTLYGVELEVCTDYNVGRLIDAFPSFHAVAKSDSSVSGCKANRFELVTKPATLRQHKIEFAGFFKKLDTQMFDTSDKHTNGMHVHIDRKAFENEDCDTLHLQKFSWFWTNPVNHGFLMAMSDRDVSSLNSYSKLVTSSKMTDSKKQCEYGGKMVALNFKHPKTIEVRLFKGIVSFATILKNLEFVDALVEFTRVASMKDCVSTKFLQWLDLQGRSNYRSLRLCLKDIEDPELLKKKSEIENTVINGYDIADMLKNLNKIEDIHLHVETVNRAFRRTVWIAQHELVLEGRVFKVKSEQTRYAKYDTDLLSKYRFAS